MKSIRSFILRLLILFMLIAGPVVFFSQIVQAQETGSYAEEQDNLSKIATFRDNYIPKEYLPLPEYLVFIDMAVLVLILILGLFFIIKRKPAGWFSWLAVSTLAYLGLIRGGCICPMGLTTNVIMSIIDPYHVSMAGLIIFVAPLLIALIAGRVFCTSGCPLGAVQHLIYKKKKDYKIPLRINRYIKLAPVMVFLVTVFFALKGKLYIGCELDPYKPVFFSGKAWTEQAIAYITGQPMESKFLFSFGVFGWLYLIAALVSGYWIQRPFCRFLCPYSVLLGVTSMISFRKRNIDEVKCNYCGLCAKKCPTQAITINKKSQVQTLSSYDCIQCNRCSDSCKLNAI